MKASGRRRKGSNGEREVVALFVEAGIPARRVPLSGAMSESGFGGDVLVTLYEGTTAAGDPLKSEERIEVKRRGQGFKRIEAWIADNYAVAFRADRGEWMLCIRLTDWIDTLRREQGAGE